MDDYDHLNATKKDKVNSAYEVEEFGDASGENEYSVAAASGSSVLFSKQTHDDAAVAYNQVNEEESQIVPSVRVRGVGTGQVESSSFHSKNNLQATPSNSRLPPKTNVEDNPGKGHIIWNDTIHNGCIIFFILIALVGLGLALSSTITDANVPQFETLQQENSQLQEEIANLTMRNIELSASYENISKIIADLHLQVNLNKMESYVQGVQLEDNLNEYVQQTKQLINQTNREIQQNANKIEQLMRGVLLLDGRIILLSGYEYILTDSEQSWSQSRESCKAKDSDLAAKGMRDPDLRRLIASALSPEGSEGEWLWIGVNDINSEGRFVWTDGEAATDSNVQWHFGEPNDINSNQDCVAMYSGGAYKAIDAYCSTNIHAICERALSIP